MKTTAAQPQAPELQQSVDTLTGISISGSLYFTATCETGSAVERLIKTDAREARWRRDEEERGDGKEMQIRQFLQIPLNHGCDRTLSAVSLPSGKLAQTVSHRKELRFYEYIQNQLETC